VREISAICKEVFFTMRTAKCWNRLPREAVVPPSLDMFNSAGGDLKQTDPTLKLALL